MPNLERGVGRKSLAVFGKELNRERRVFSWEAFPEFR